MHPGRPGCRFVLYARWIFCLENEQHGPRCSITVQYMYVFFVFCWRGGGAYNTNLYVGLFLI